MNKRAILFFLIILSLKSYSQDLGQIKDSIWTFKLSVIQYPFKEDGCIPIKYKNKTTAKCQVISTNCPLGISVIFIERFSLYERGINYEKNVTLTGRIKVLEEMTPTCLGMKPVITRTYLIPEFLKTTL